jgi:hypothetical protein
VGAGVTVFDTAHAYGLDDADRGHNERLLARALRACGAAATARVITKGGMARPGGAWVPDGRAKAIRADCEASIAALAGIPIDLYLLHAPDPRTPWRTSVRALGRVLDEGVVRGIGLSGVNRGQLDEALALLAQAQVNLVARLIAHAGALPAPDELRALARREPGMLTPTAQMRAARELEPPAADEGFAVVERIEFERAAAPEGARPGVFVAAAAVGRPGFQDAIRQGDPEAPHLVFDWRPDGRDALLEAARAELAEAVAGPVDAALCPHAGGPPRCWCRPPLPGLALTFAAAHRVDPARSFLVGTGPAHRTLARALGARYAAV